MIILRNIPQELKRGLTKKVTGKFKGEAAGKQITDFDFLLAKLYSNKLEDVEERKCKGMKKNFKKRYYI